jgi:outer membrane murein-binding lipoprotein Lpp
VIYAKYYLTLEKVFRYYTRYEKEFNMRKLQNIITIKEATIVKDKKALMKKDEAISQKRNTVESIMARLDEMQNEARAGTKKLETKIDSVSSDNKKLKTKVGQLHQKSNKAMDIANKTKDIANKTMAKLNETFDLLKDVAYKSASLPDDPKKHHYLGITLSVSRQKNTNLPVYKLYTTRRQSRDIGTVMKKRLPGTGEKHVGCSIILCGPIYTMSPISSVNSFREKFEERCSELIDQRYQNDEDDDLTVEDIMNHIQVKDSNNISWFSNPYISVVDIVAMMIDEIKIAQRDAYDVPCEWPRLMKANETNKPIFDDRIRKIGFKDPDMILQEVSSIVKRVNTLVATHNNPQN